MDLTGAVWRKSTYSGPNGGNCVEVARLAGAVAVRDSKRGAAGPAIALTPAQWRDLLHHLRIER